MLLAEDLVLLLYDDTSGQPLTDFTRLETALAGALLLELSIRGRVSIGDGRGAGRAGRLIVASPGPVGEPVLDKAMAIVAAAKGKKKPKELFGKLKKGLRVSLLEGLRERGIVHQVPAKGRFVAPWWPALDSTHEAHVREQLSGVLISGAHPDLRTGALISLLDALGVVDKVLPVEDHRALKRRAKEVAEGTWAADAVGTVIRDMNAAIVAAIGASVAVIIG